MPKHATYHDDNVQSLEFIAPSNGKRATLGGGEPGSWEFTTGDIETFMGVEGKFTVNGVPVSPGKTSKPFPTGIKLVIACETPFAYVCYYG